MKMPLLEDIRDTLVVEYAKPVILQIIFERIIEIIYMHRIHSLDTLTTSGSGFILCPA